MKYLIKPLTKRMFAHLQRGRSIELSKTDRHICGIDDYKGSLSGLYKRGLVDIKKVTVNGKDIDSVFITNAGINFLERYQENIQKSGQE